MFGGLLNKLPTAKLGVEVLTLPETTVAVAFSGGRDSLALLHATCRSAVALNLQVVALHVHHGLLPEADDWVTQAQHLCANWQRQGWPLRLRWARLKGRPAAGESIEAWARAKRYAMLAELAQEEGASLVLLAQHRRDQAETVLLQALRGGGPAGLAAMPKVIERAGLTWARPWLMQPRESIDAYVRCHQLSPVEDPSNLDNKLARSRLRLRVWPALQAAFADAESALASVAHRAQEASAALAELAALDLAALVDDEGGLQVAGWQTLSAARQANALRAWWAALTGRGAPNTLVQRLVLEVPGRSAARWPASAGWFCVLHRGRLRAQVQRAELHDAPVMVMDLSRPGHWPVPAWGGVFEVLPCSAQGVLDTALQAVELRHRSGGERFQASQHGLARSLKKQYQSAGVAEHARAGPLLWWGKNLLFVPGLGVDARRQAADGASQLTLRWWPDAAPSGPEQASG